MKQTRHDNKVVHERLSEEGIKPSESRGTGFNSHRHYHVIPPPLLAKITKPPGNGPQAKPKDKIRFKTIPRVRFKLNGNLVIDEAPLVVLKRPNSRHLSLAGQAWRMLVRASLVALQIGGNHDFYHGYWKFLTGNFKVSFLKLRSFLRLYHRVSSR